MGFYSIYKIIKDMIRTLFGNKFLKLFIIVILIFSIILFTNSKSVFAVTPVTLTYNQETHNFTLNNTDYKVNDSVFTMPYLLFYEDPRPNQYWIRIVASSQPFYFTQISNGQYRISCDTLTDIYYSNFYYIPNNYFNSVNTTPLSSYYYYTLNNETLSNDFYISQDNIFYLNFNIYDYNNRENTLFSSNEIVTYNPPTLGNTSTELENLSFTNFIINANDYTEEIEQNDGTLYMLFYNRSLSNSQTTDGLYPIKEKGFTKGSIYTDVENSTSDNMVFTFPIFKSGVFFNIGSTYEIRFAKKYYNTEWNTDFYEFFDNSYTFTISSNVTQDYINQINQQTATSTDEDDTQELQNSINQQTQSIDNINNSITDSSVDSSSIDLPTDNTQNITQSGVDNIFQTIYNGFTSGTPQNIVFPLPYSSNNITIQPNYITQMLNSSERRKNCLLSYSSFLLVRDK